MYRSNTLHRIALGVLVAGLAACSEAPSAPSAVQPADVDAPAFAKGGNGGNKTDGVVYATIHIDPTRTDVYKLGPDHWVYIPAGAVCALDSSYGLGEWDQPCTPANHVVSVDAIITTKDGIPTANFYPDLRFAPAAEGDYANWVFLGFKVKPRFMKDWEKFAVLYRPTGSIDLIDESLTDPTLRAFRWDGLVVRRLKHFSGYNVSLGLYDEQPSDPFGSVLGEVQ